MTKLGIGLPEWCAWIKSYPHRWLISALEHGEQEPDWDEDDPEYISYEEYVQTDGHTVVESVALSICVAVTAEWLWQNHSYWWPATAFRGTFADAIWSALQRLAAQKTAPGLETD